MNERSRTQLEKLLAYHAQGIFGLEEAANQIATLATVEDAGEMLAYVPEPLQSAVRSELVREASRFVGGECLQPEDSPFEIVGTSYKENYYGKIARTLLVTESHHDRPQLSVVCLPSFEPEWALLLLDVKRVGFMLSLRTAKSPIWPPERTEEVDVDNVRVKIDDALADGMKVAWEKMMRRVRHALPSSVVLDGVSYHFSFRAAAGRTHSPHPETAPGRLVELSHALRAYVEASDAARSAIRNSVLVNVEWFRQLA
ncbi:hypothetical protein [Lacipirellula parvula]|uniref:Uncharacterized protein n=1 Tax=Lacipirellula parvula TaxID=2650471 RepID=A0A5K7XGX4_9BACT|nr:hypothetical protein [Lacipirellula parvula]BBO36120.1 hypothetical protein PLANPX_5732 [Lacipirellula parvula]